MRKAIADPADKDRTNESAVPQPTSLHFVLDSDWSKK